MPPSGKKVNGKTIKIIITKAVKGKILLLKSLFSFLVASLFFVRNLFLLARWELALPILDGRNRSTETIFSQI